MFFKPADDGVEEVGDDAGDGERDDDGLEKPEDVTCEPDEADEECTQDAD